MCVTGSRLRCSSGWWPLRGLTFTTRLLRLGCDSVHLESVDDAVAARLVDEFGEDGRRCVEFLETARVLLCGGFRSVPRRGQMVAYCLREAMGAVLDAARLGDAGRWREVSRGVVAAGGEYRRVEDSGSERDRLLGVLLARVDDLERFHREERLRRRRLNDVMVNLTGAAPVSARVSPVDAYQELCVRLNDIVHSPDGGVNAEGLWSECLATLRLLFLPPGLRFPELEELAQVESPTAGDRDRVVGLVASPQHLRRFLGGVVSPAWLVLLSETGHLDPPDSRAVWPADTAVERLAVSYPEEVVGWLEDMYRQHGQDPTRAAHIARAAAMAGELAVELMLTIVSVHQQHRTILHWGIRSARRLPASVRRVEDFAEVILNPASWSQAVAPWGLLRLLSEGATKENAERRIRLLCYKIRLVPPGDFDLWSLQHDASGSIADSDSTREYERVPALLACLIETVTKSLEWVPLSNLMALVGLMPGGLSERMRVWILARVPSANPQVLIDEITHAISSRSPTGDDLALVDRAVGDCEPSDYTGPWSSALGKAPTITEVGGALREHDIPSDWFRSAEWVLVLPTQCAGGWASPAELLIPDKQIRDRLEQKSPMVTEVQSPLSTQELNASEPVQAARRIAEWRPAPGDWPDPSWQLASTVEAVVKQHPARWLSAPIRIVRALREPLYIGSYLQAAADAALAPEQDLPVKAFLDTIQLIRCHPWPATQPSEHNDWRNAERAAIWLIRALAGSGCDFGGRRGEVWAILESEATNCPPRPETTITHTDPHQRAINRSCTQALDAALFLVDNEQKTSAQLRPEAIRILDVSLHLAGPDGADHRSVLATRLGFLRHVAADWFNTNVALLLGADAPDGLGQVTVDQALKWGPPDPWLLENCRQQVRNAADNNVERALYHLMQAMLWELPGYTIDETIHFVRRTARLMSDAGELLGRMLRHDTAEPHQISIAVKFWQAALEAAATSDALLGFGWYSEIKTIDTEVWQQMTLQTLTATGGRTSWTHGVATRIASSAPTRTGLAILNELIRGQGDDWDRRDATEQAAQLIASAGALRGTVEYRNLRNALIERGQLNV